MGWPLYYRDQQSMWLAAYHRNHSAPERRRSITSRQSPGLTEFQPIMPEHGVTHYPEFENWANKVWSLGANPRAEVSLKDFRKDIVMDLYNQAGQVVIAYKIYRCWVSEYAILPDVDANAKCRCDQARHARKRMLGRRPIGERIGRAVFQ